MTNREKKQIAKKIARRKAYEKQRNLAHGRKKVAPNFKGQEGIDGAEYYKQLKEQYKDDPAYKHENTKENGVVKFMKNLFRGKQRGGK